MSPSCCRYEPERCKWLIPVSIISISFAFLFCDMLAVPYIQSIYFLSFPITVGHANGSLLLGTSGYCIALPMNATDGMIDGSNNATNGTTDTSSNGTNIINGARDVTKTTQSNNTGTTNHGSGGAANNTNNGSNATTTASNGSNATTTASNGSNATTTAINGSNATTTASNGSDATPTGKDMPTINTILNPINTTCSDTNFLYTLQGNIAAQIPSNQVIVRSFLVYVVALGIVILALCCSFSAGVREHIAWGVALFAGLLIIVAIAIDLGFALKRGGGMQGGMQAVGSAIYLAITASAGLFIFVIFVRCYKPDWRSSGETYEDYGDSGYRYREE